MPARRACLQRGLKSARRASQLAFPNAAPAPPLLPKAPTNTFPTIINASPSSSQGGSSRKLRTEKRPLAGEGSRAPPCQPLAISHCNHGPLPRLGASLKPRPGLVSSWEEWKILVTAWPPVFFFPALPLAALWLSRAILVENYTRSTANMLSNTFACGTRPNCKGA